MDQVVDGAEWSMLFAIGGGPFSGHLPDSRQRLELISSRGIDVDPGAGILRGTSIATTNYGGHWCAACSWSGEDHDQLAVAEPTREIHRRQVRVPGEATRCRNRVLEPRSRLELIDCRRFNLAPDFDDDRQGGRGVLDDDWGRGTLVQSLEERVDDGNGRNQADCG